MLGRTGLLIAGLAAVVASGCAQLNTGVAPFRKNALTVGVQLITDELSAVTDLIGLPGAGDTMLVADIQGYVHVIRDGRLVSEPVLDISDVTITGQERGLLALAVHPGFEDPSSFYYRKVYTVHTEKPRGEADFYPTEKMKRYDNHTILSEWKLGDAEQFIVDSKRELFRSARPGGTHIAGALAFGPDGMLYVASGDGGGAGDNGPGHSPQGNAQDNTNIFGTILRIDPTGNNSTNGQYGIPADNPYVNATGEQANWVPEIWCYGLRNPWRIAFDPSTGKLYTGDVGQYQLEEVNLLVRGGNYGWPLKEGSQKYNRVTGAVSKDVSGLPPGLIDPIAEYDHTQGICIIGGFPYRGSGVPQLRGQYVFAEMDGPGSSGQLLFCSVEGGIISRADMIQIDSGKEGVLGNIYAFGRDNAGELYVLTATGRVWKIVPAPRAR